MLHTLFHMEKVSEANTPVGVGWSSVLVGIHWITVLLITLVFALVIGREVFEDDKTLRLLMLNWHRYGGTLVFALVLARLPVRLMGDRPRHEMRPLMNLAAAGGHFALYGLMLALPLLGYALAASRYGHVDFLGIQLPQILSKNRDLAETLEPIHGYLGWALLAVIGAHAVAALMHHYVLKDNVLKAMLPGRRAT